MDTECNKCHKHYIDINIITIIVIIWINVRIFKINKYFFFIIIMQHMPREFVNCQLMAMVLLKIKNILLKNKKIPKDNQIAVKLIKFEN